MGVIDVLLERGYRIAGIAGCSMGAVVGGIYAAGYHDAYRQWLLQLTRQKVFSLFDFTLTKSGFVKGEKVFQVLSQFIQLPPIESFPIPFTAVAADIVTHKEVWYRSGNLQKALRASIAIPGVFTPVQDGDRVLVDGGVLNPLPLNAVEKKEGDIVIAVNLNGHAQAQQANTGEKTDDANLLQDILSWLRFNNNHKGNTPMEKRYANTSVGELLQYSFHLTQDRVVELMLSLYRPEILIEIPRNACNTFDFHRAAELMEMGRQTCAAVLDAWEAENGMTRK